MKNRFPREFYIPKGAAKVADKKSSAVAYLYEGKVGRLYAMGFHGKADKPDFHYSFRTASLRETYVKQFFEGRQARDKMMAERQKKRTDFENPYKVGDLFKQSWGYEQTNINWFECVAVSGKMLTVREIAQETSQDGYMSGKCVPLPGQFLSPSYEGDRHGRPIRCRAQEGGIKVGPHNHHWASYQPGQIIAGVKVHQPSYWSSYH